MTRRPLDRSSRIWFFLDFAAATFLSEMAYFEKPWGFHRVDV
jgi:hypothetical protein